MSNIIDFNSFKSKNNKKQQSLSLVTTVTRKNNLYILIGIPCSGKSTYASRYLNKPNTVIISSDEVRNELMGTCEFYKKTNDLVFDSAKYMIKNALSKGLDVVFDATNTNSRNRKSILKIAKEISCKTTAIIFLTPIQICINRNLKRSKERQIPLEVILRMAKFDSDKVHTEGFDEVKYVK